MRKAAVHLLVAFGVQQTAGMLPPSVDIGKSVNSVAIHPSPSGNKSPPY
jgi:hypothetical protein